MHFLLFYEKAADFAERQKPFADAHRTYLTAAVERHVLLGGNLSDPADGSAVLLLRCDSRSQAEDVARNDPYVVNGIVRRWSVRSWDIVIGAWLDGS